MEVLGRRRLRLGRWLSTVASVLFLLGAGLYVAYRSDRQFVAEVAKGVDAGRNLTDAQRLEIYVGYAFHGIRNPRYEEINPWPVRLYYALNPMHPGPGDVLRWGSDYRGGCGSHTRAVQAMLQARGVRSRPLFILDDRGHSIHTVVEARIGSRWIVADPLCGVVYHRRDGALATRQDLAADTVQFRAQVKMIPGYDRRYDYDSVTLLNWKKVPLLLPALRWLLTRIIGPDRVAAIERPEIWMWPRALASLTCLVTAALSAFAAWQFGGDAASKPSTPRAW